ncbi:twin-arginine translocation signal domain-containing protein [Tautonia sociabilis]|uniref:Twin-arginine translocation signal domain-containing protein n=1 Tax=Tautonia sociabilis TaxID=2080755 RepID=A0A432MKM4_9BACT|nr:twin-arginine translocation signal domain-containing protein [Tautonia sociabilis]RUL87686.1 twin-arginine translocation signal domain-containing protein [Tautonia sociabilis]
MTGSNPNRRSFLKAAGAAGLCAAAARFSRAADDQDGPLPVVGSGEYQYECLHGWGKVPDHIEWYETHGVAVDRDGLIYVTHRAGPDRPSSDAMAQDTIVVFDPDGTFVRSFGKRWHGGGHGIDIREEGGQEFLYLAFMFPVNLVVKTDLKGEVVWIKEKPEEPGVYADPEARFSPTNVAFSPDGGFYVGDGYGSNYIHQYDKNGEWVRTWGGTGTEPGKMRTPHGIWFDDRPGREADVVVADRANARLQYFSPDGAFKAIVDEVSFPAHFDIRGDVLLVPDLHARVSLFDRENNVISHLGYDPDWTAEVLDGFTVRVEPDRWRPGRFVHPHDACFDAEGNIFVAEWVRPGRLTKLRKRS